VRLLKLGGDGLPPTQDESTRGSPRYAHRPAETRRLFAWRPFEVHIEQARSMVSEGPTPFEAAAEPLTTERGKSAVPANNLKPAI
jgi:hypothetical protein